MTPTETSLSLLFGSDEAGRAQGLVTVAAMEQEVARARAAGDFRGAAAIAGLVSAICGLAAVQQAEEQARNADSGGQG